MKSKHWIVDHDKYLMRELDGEQIILNLETSDYYTIDGAGAVIFRMITEDRSPEEIVAAVVAEYSVQEKTALKDVLDLIDQLKKKKIVTIPSKDR